jgi:hypothetical protein
MRPAPSQSAHLDASGSAPQRDHVRRRAQRSIALTGAAVAPQLRELRRGVCVGLIVQIAFDGGGVTMAHHPLDLVDLELADRLRAERMAQLVKGQPRQTSSLASTDEAPLTKRR